MTPLDIQQHRLDRIRTLERRVQSLTRYREQQERVLALAVIALAQAVGCTAEAILEALCAIEQPDVTELLRETA